MKERIRSEDETPGAATDRRTFLGYVIAAIGAFITVVVGIPLIGSFVLPTLRGRQAGWTSAGRAAQFAAGQPKAASVTIVQRDGWIQSSEDRGVWVVRRGESDFTVYNGRCTHLGCAYSWRGDVSEFQCPCHAGRYSLDGVVLGGPPPRPLDTLQWRVEQGELLVEYVDFLLGIPQKEEV